MNTLRRARWLAPATAVALGLGACGSSGEQTAPVASASSPAATTEAPGQTATAAPAPGKQVIFTFNSYLDPKIGLSKGGSNVIRVHSSPHVSSFTGDTYMNRQKEIAACAEPDGRNMQRDTSVGELPGESNDWVGLQPAGSVAVEYYAPLVYGELPEGAFEQLPPCPE